jgi:hypothetical protein
MRTAVFLMTNTEGRFCVLRSIWSGTRTLPNEWSTEPRVDFETLLTQFVRYNHWSSKEVTYLGPDRRRYVTADGYFFLDGARGGLPPAGWTTEWITLKQMRAWLIEGQFENPNHVDRALSLFEKHCRSPTADPC